MTWPDNTFIVCPSYRRPDTIQTKTLAFLDRLGVPTSKVYIYVANIDEMVDYRVALFGSKWEHRLYLGVPGVNNVRNLIQKSFPEGTHLIYIDDDVRRLSVKNLNVTAKTPRRLQAHEITGEELVQLIREGRHLCSKHNARIWGVYPASNPMFMRNQIFMGLTYIVAAFFGMIVTHDEHIYTRYPVKEDHERTLRYYTQDGKVIRFENVGLETSYFGGHGGLHHDSVEARHKRADPIIDKLVAEFPDLCKVWQKKDYRDIKLKRIGNLIT